MELQTAFTAWYAKWDADKAGALIAAAAAGIITTEERWLSRDNEIHHGGVTLVDGHLSGANGGGYLILMEPSPANTWNSELPVQ